MRQKFIEYIQNLSIPNRFKLDILDENFINNNPSYYQNYATLFADAFSIELQVIERLNIAGYLYYRATLITDSLIDEKDVSKFPILTICQEESIKILTTIFGLENIFWILWNTRRSEYLDAIHLEKSFLKKEVISISEYELLADKKAAFGKVAIDCMYSTDNRNQNLYEQLLLSHKYFSVAFQLNDDIQDLKEDLKKGQFNWAIYLLKQQDLVNNEPEIVEKYLYIRKIANEIYSLAISYCERALDVVDSIDVPEWKIVINDTKKRFIVAIKEVDNYLEILTADINLSKNKKNTYNAQSGISKAVEFIKNAQKRDGSWREYINQGGISSTWATAFIVSKISENVLLKSSLKNEISNALLFLQNNQIGGLWSYNTSWIEDADSTNFALLSYCLNDKVSDSKTIKRWLEFQSLGDGFSTYNDKKKLITALNDKNIDDVSGWLNTHHCVSAVSFYFLLKNGKNEFSFTKLKDYFEKDFESKLNSYWWTSEIYTLYYLAKTYHLLREKLKIRIIVNLIKEQQNDNGSFGDQYGENLFYTGLALDILLLEEELSVLEIEKTIGFLLQNQYEDGTWDNSHALQIPNSFILEPEKCYYPVATFGMNVRAKEFNRLFTTSAILLALSNYEQIFSTSTFK